QRQLAHDGKELGLLVDEAPDPREMLAQLLGGRSAGRHARTKPLHRVFQDAADECFLGWEVVVEGRDVDTGRGSNVAGAEAFESQARDLLIGRRHQILAPIDGWRYRAALLLHLEDISLP